jgi:type II secretory pathway component GspD/PulD (secretin)
LVIGADADTIETIERLVKLWDVPDKVDDSRVRYTQIVPIKYSRAELLVETMKEAFRDLLSSNDKAFQKKNSDEKGGESNEAAPGSSVTSEGGMNFSFSGKLSFGVDKVTNSILVSSEKQLLELIVSTIVKLDEAAKPSANIEVHKIDLAGQESFKKALQAILGQESKKQPTPPNGEQPGQNENNQRGMETQAGAPSGFSGRPSSNRPR